MENIFERVKKIISDKLGIDESDITMDSHIENDLGADSLDKVELLMEFEREFNIGIEDEKIENVIYLSQICEVIESLLKNKTK